MTTPNSDIELEGNTAFLPPPAPSYRYVITLKNERLTIWMEDFASKQQWYKGNLDQADYAMSDSTLSDASMSDISRFSTSCTAVDWTRTMADERCQQKMMEAFSSPVAPEVPFVLGSVVGREKTLV
ncbi:hypothetical protein PHYPSEUDO_003686 [Phytophthora pseudosyringae]|uniref:Uncharacterized protein n=1 Tax=Phytophthora pseudosyringae TaxID=221518 RepID=A0A8T1VR66_9STRA|nr:hypothetical protein PHYPSEUDO_003686 [Phytophthora pseudosyringae]